MNYRELSQKVKQKYPGVYDDLDDKDLAQKIVQKHPEYSDTTFDGKMSLEGFGQNVLKDIPYQAQKIGSGLVDVAKQSYTAPFEAPKMLFQTGKALYQGQPFSETPIAQAPRQLFETAKSLPAAMTENVRHPYEHPVGAAIDIASVAAPFMGGAKAAPLLSKVPKTPSMFTRGAAKVLSALGPEEEAVLARISNPEAIKTAGTIADVSNTFPGVADKFKTIVGHLSDKAKEVISTTAEGAFSKDEVMGSVAKARRNLGGVYTDESKTAAKALERIDDRFRRTRNTISQNQVKGIIEDLDSEIPWTKVWKSPESLTATDRALIDLRTNLDGSLKSKNPLYAERMKPVSDAIQARGEFIKKFNIENVKGQGYQLGDTTVNRAANALKENKVASQRILQGVKETTGEDIQSKLQSAQYREQFETPTSNTLDDILRTKPETLITFIQNRFGRQIAGKMSDLLSKELPSKTSFLKTGATLNILTKAKAAELLDQVERENPGLSMPEIKEKARELAKVRKYKWPTSSTK